MNCISKLVAKVKSVFNKLLPAGISGSIASVFNEKSEEQKDLDKEVSSLCCDLNFNDNRYFNQFFEGDRQSVLDRMDSIKAKCVAAHEKQMAELDNIKEVIKTCKANNEEDYNSLAW